MNKFLGVIGYMLKEDLRLYAAMIGRIQFFFFPVFILFASLILSVTSPLVLKDLSVEMRYFLLYSFVFLYGLMVGGFALFSDQMAERRIGKLNLLLMSPAIQPISYQYQFMAFYIKDVIFYLLFTIAPISLGMAIAIPLSGLGVGQFLLIVFLMCMTFLIGISFSFYLSTFLVRWKPLFAVQLLAVVALAVVGFATDLYEPWVILPPAMFQQTYHWIHLVNSVLMITVFSLVATHFIKVEPGTKNPTFKPEYLKWVVRYKVFGRYSKWVAKDWLDMNRSGMVSAVFGGYTGPLIMLGLMVWFLRSVVSIDIDFNVVFFAALIGFLGMVIYSFLNMLDTQQYNQILPMTVSDIIRTKLWIFTAVTTTVSTIFVTVLAIMTGGLKLLPLGLIVAWTTTQYTVRVVAYLTGLRTNSYLFDPIVLIKFAVLVTPPLVFLTIASFSFESSFWVTSAVVGAGCLILIGLAVFFDRRISKKWDGESFVFGV